MRKKNIEIGFELSVLEDYEQQNSRSSPLCDVFSKWIKFLRNAIGPLFEKYCHIYFVQW